jgi:hypothetical protein
MDPSKVLNKIPRSRPLPSANSIYMSPIATSKEIAVVEPFNILIDGHSSIDATALHSTNTALNDLVHKKQPLHTSARKFIPRLASTIEWLLAENTILKLELKQSKDVLEARKARESGKQLVLKRKIVVSTDEILKAIEEAEATTRNKQQRTCRPQGRLRKNAPAVSVVILDEAPGKEEGSVFDMDVLSESRLRICPK